MKRSKLEALLMKLWTTTQMPLTAGNIQAVSGLSTKELDKHLRALGTDGFVDLDIDAEVPAWVVVGVDRATRGPTTAEDVQALWRLQSEVGASSGASSSAALARRGAAGMAVADEKSLLASGLMSFFLGPFGWLYAASLKDAGIAVGVTMGLSMLLPASIVGSVLGPLAPIFGGLGVWYAHRYNKTGRRASLLPGKASA